MTAAMLASTTTQLADVSFPGIYTWNPSDKSVEITLTNGDLTADADFAGDHALVRCTDPRVSGKYYFEIDADIVLLGASDRMWIGLCTSSTPLTDYVGQDTPALGYRALGGLYAQNNANTGSGPQYDDGDVVMVAVDLGTLDVWFGLNGSWNSGNPATGSGAADTLDSANTFFPAVSLRAATTQQVTAAFSAGTMTHNVPEGFLPWSADNADGLVTMPANPINVRTRDTSGGVGTATAIYTFNTSGRFLETGNSTPFTDSLDAATDFDSTSWYAGKGTDNIGSDYEIFVTNQQVTGVNGSIDTVPTLDTWLPLSTNRTFEISSTGNNIETNYQVTWDISIRDVATMTVLATSTLDLRTNLFGP